jgi:tetratricopeptide (TPR) repeat protein
MCCNSLTGAEFYPIIAAAPMSDPLPAGPARPSDSHEEADREARIEQLLLSGLDHYFAGEYERAISVWTRVVFLERHHDRARAYIERARSALAERQREADELFHDGVLAYNAGDVAKARDLLTRAVELGSDTAHVFLDRLHRVGSGGAAVPAEKAPPRVPAPRGSSPSSARRGGWVAAALAAFVVAAAMLLGGLPIGTWLSSVYGSAPAPLADPLPSEPLPVVRASETVLTRAEALYAQGRLRDALLALERIDIADPYRQDADRLRAAIQRDLLTATDLRPSSSVGAGPPP